MKEQDLQSTEYNLVKFQVFRATNTKMDVGCDVMPCILVNTDWRFGVTYFLRHQGDEMAVMMEAVSFSEMSVIAYRTTRRNIPEDGDLQEKKLIKIRPTVGNLSYEMTQHKNYFRLIISKTVRRIENRNSSHGRYSNSRPQH